nr:hypothetical protein CFP56_13573 [Quercus suber]
MVVKRREVRMMRKQKPGEPVPYTMTKTKTKIELEKVEKLSSSEELSSLQFCRFNELKHASVIPAKRRTVKRMMFDDFVQFIAHVLSPRNKPSSFKIYPHNP